MMSTLVALAVLFAQLSLVAFGGGNTVLPEMQRQVVDVHHWMSAQEFGALFALAQAAPGPNLMIVVLIGWHVAGWPGVLVSSIAKFGPSSLLTALALHGWERFKDRPWRPIVQRGILPITVGLVIASAFVIGRASAGNWTSAAIIAASTLLMTRTRLHPLFVLAAGAVIGLAGVGA